MSNHSKISSDYVSDILDEIALEGLDGITAEALWMRLSVRQNFTFKIDENVKEFLWGIIIRLNDVKFYEIPEPRTSLKYYDCIAVTDNTNAVLELDEVYPYCSVKNNSGVFGSCQHFFTRVDITLEVIHMNLKEVEENWCNRLVIVASQELRNFALLGFNCTPNLDFSKTPIQYDILERIGRCRHLGLTTCGKGSLQTIVEDSKSIFHYLKFLAHNKLIKKQSLLGSLHFSSNASKVYLTRFFEEASNENINILQTAIEELKARPPNYMIPCDEFYAMFDLKCKGRIKKYKKSAVFKKYITLTKNLPYRTFFPNASPAEYGRKSKNGERIVRCFQLINPDVELSEMMEKDCDAEDEDSISGFVPRGIYYKNMPIAAQAYHHIKESGTLGMTIAELSAKMGINKSFARCLIKRLTTDKYCKFFIENDGRRRSKRYIVGENIQAKAAASEIAQILSQTSPPPAVPDSKVAQEKEQNQLEAMAAEKINLSQLQEENASYRSLKRIGLILKTIKAHKFRLFHQIAKFVNEEEVREGITSKVDRATIHRILQKLDKDGLIKTITLTGKEDTGHTVKLYVVPSFDLDDKLAETLYHTHLSFNIPAEPFKIFDKEQVNLEQEFSGRLIENLTEMKKMLEGVMYRPEPPNENGRGESVLIYSPKFIRLNILHDLIFHLVYDYTGVVDKPQEELMEELSKTTPVDEDLKKEMPRLYGTQLSTYMFVPPLETSGKMPGWFLISDLLIRMPMSVMIKVLRMGEACPEIWKYLHHPVRKHFLVKDLPLSIRQMFFNRKHHLNSIYFDLRRLCFIGVLQFGMKFGREYYQTSLYLNRRASLLDTSTSPPEYYQVPPDMQFETKSYYFETKNEVKKYWMDMFNICAATSLGVKTNMIGKEILAERELCKESLKKLVEPKSVEKVLQDDDGRIPGDKLGAAGLDSVMFSFLRSNWTGPISKSKELTRDNKIFKMPLQKLKKEQGIRGRFLKRSRRRKPVIKTEKIDFLELQEKLKTRKFRKIKEKEFRFKRRKKSAYDEVDLEALKLMNTLRVTWSTAEDNLLLICRVAMMFLCPNARTFVRIPWVEVRKVLQQNLPESRNKTQKAIARRIIYMMKNPTTVRSVNLCLEEFKEMPEARVRFDCTDLLNSIKPSTPNLTELQSQLYDKFHDLVCFLKDRFIDNTKLNVQREDEDLIPDTLEEFLDKFQVKVSTESCSSVKNIRENVIRAILLSSLSCRADKTSSAIQLFDIYRQYDDVELQSAIKKLHADKVITMSKKAGTSIFKDGKILPLTFSPYKLSFAFQHMLTMKYTHSIYPESFSQVNCLLGHGDGEEFLVDLNDCNVALFLLASKDLVSFRTVLPDQIIALDSGDLSDSAYSRMLERYCEILQLSNANSKVVCTSGKIITKSEDGESLAKKRRLSEYGGESAFGKKEEMSSENLNEKTTKSSRIILYIMREEAKKDAQGDPSKLLQDSCVVNASKVMSTIKKEQLELYSKQMESKVASGITKKIISRSLVPLHLVGEESVLKKLGKAAGAAKSVLDLIGSKKEMGATVEDVKSHCRQDDLVDILARLTQSKVIIRSGIGETRYVSQKYSTPWLLNSFKMTRLEREKVKPNELTAITLAGDESPAKKKKGLISSERLKSQDYNPPACSTDVNNKLKIIIRPWIRIDGSLNRKVLDRFLGAILSFIMSNPGVTLKGIMSKFSPFITPVWTKDLVEILDEIGCLSFTQIIVRETASLFSKSVVQVSNGRTGLEDDVCVAVEAKVDAIITLGFFIGKKTYSRDFLVD